MTKDTKLRLPFFYDYPFGNRRVRAISPSLNKPEDDFIIIESNILHLKTSSISLIADKTIDLESIIEIVILEKQVSYWKKDHTLDIYAQQGTDISLVLVDNHGKKHELIPKFFVSYALINGKGIWDRFVSELIKFLDLPIKKEQMS